MILHCRHTVLSSEIKNIAVWSPDMNTAILLAHHFEDLRCTQLWFHTGLADKARSIPIHKICSKLGKEICKTLVSFHALTGCDLTSGFAPGLALITIPVYHAHTRLSRLLPTS